ncbi:MAG: type II secretion system protein [Candidatus Delongbacteria bacterium]|jgi:prepilin-type N-terminal cleavage/methylation domain-containing protein|nr:type II secretion system protein [Candidatus Delongbacteria bacterium]
MTLMVKRSKYFNKNDSNKIDTKQKTLEVWFLTIKYGGNIMKKGITLIEVLVTAIILSIGLASMMMSFVTCQNTIRRNTNKFNATLVANQQFEAIQRRVFETSVNDYLDGIPNGTYVESNLVEFGDGSTTKQKYFLKFNSSTTLNPSASSNLTLIELRVSWDEEYIYADTDKSITMQMITNEPY